MLLFLAFLAVVPSTVHSACTTTAALSPDSKTGFVGEEVTLTCTFQDCASEQYQIGDEEAVSYGAAVPYTLTDVASVDFKCLGSDDAENKATVTVYCAPKDFSTATLEKTDTGLALSCPVTQGDCENANKVVPADLVTGTMKDKEDADVTVARDGSSTTFLATITVAQDSKYTGTCSAGGVTGTVTYDMPGIALSADASANGEKFSVSCTSNGNADVKLYSGDTEVNYDAGSMTATVSAGVSAPTKYTCKNAQFHSETVDVACLEGMTAAATENGTCSDGKPLYCEVGSDGKPKPSCAEAKYKNDKDNVCRCPTATPFYDKEEKKCQETCGASGIYISVIVLIAAMIDRLL